MKRRLFFLHICLFGVAALLFFYKTLFFGLLPVPSDALVGLYHPWRDAFAQEYPRGMPFKNFLITDPVRQQIPWRKLAADSWKRGEPPAWNPTAFSGTPLGANVQSAAFYPLNVLFLFLPFSAAWSVLILIQPVIGGIGMFLYLGMLGLAAPAAMVGAILFGFSGTAVAWMTWGTIGHVMMWTPFVLIAVERLFSPCDYSKHRPLWIILIAVLFVLQITAGHLQVALYSIGLAAIYAVWKYTMSPKDMVRKLLGFALACLSALIIILPILIPLVRFLTSTSRLAGANYMSEGFFFPPIHLIQLIAPDFFGNPATMNYWGTWNYGEMVAYAGVGGILFALLGLTAWKSNTHVRFWAFVAGASVVLTTKNPLTLAVYTAKIPILSSLQPTRLLIIFDPALAVLAAIGFDRFIREKTPAVRYICAGIGGIIGIAGVIVSYALLTTRDVLLQTNYMVARRNLIIPAALLLVSVILIEAYERLFIMKRLNFLKTAIVYCLVGVIIADLFRFGWKFLPFTDSKHFFPETQIIAFFKRQKQPFRIMTLDDRVFPPDAQAYYGLSSVGGYDPLRSARYERFIAVVEQDRSDVAPPYGFERIINPKNYRSRLFDLLRVRYLVSLEDIRDRQFSLVFQEGQTRVYEYTRALPLGHFVTTLLPASRNDAALTAMVSDDFDPRKHAVVEGLGKDAVLFLSESEDTVKVVGYSQNNTLFSTHTKEHKFLSTGLIYDPGLRATVDGKAARVYRTNYVYSGIIVPSGDHTVAFTYRLID